MEEEREIKGEASVGRDERKKVREIEVGGENQKEENSTRNGEKEDNTRGDAMVSHFHLTVAVHRYGNDAVN